MTFRLYPCLHNFDYLLFTDQVVAFIIVIIHDYFSFHCCPDRMDAQEGFILGNGNIVSCIDIIVIFVITGIKIVCLLVMYLIVNLFFI